MKNAAAKVSQEILLDRLVSDVIDADRLTGGRQHSVAAVGAGSRSAFGDLASFARCRGLQARTNHWNMARDGSRFLPALAHQLDRLDRVKVGVIHPMMRPTEPRQIIGIVVRGIAIQVRDGETGFNF